MNAPGRFLPGNTGGSTLLMALWALLLLSAVVLGWAKLVDREIGNAGEANLALEARALAHSGMAVALNPAVSRKTPLLDASLGPGRSYHAAIEGEGGKLNLNYLLSGEDPVRISMLKQYLAMRGMTLRQVQTFVDCLLDWVDADNVRRLNGAEAGPGYQPENRPLASLDEVPAIRGSGPLVANPHWKDDLTLLSDGPLDLEAAPADLIGLLPGIGQSRAEQFVKLRRGPDGRDGTADDLVFSSLADAVASLGLTPEQFAQIAPLVSFRDPVTRIRSVGKAANVSREIDAVVRKMPGSKPQILFWNED